METKQGYEPTNKTYEIATINDFAQVATLENLDLILKDFKTMLESIIVLRKITSREPEPMSVPLFTWIDDGKHDFNGVVLSCPEMEITLNQEQFNALKEAFTK